ncbi:methyl-CpG-binding domain protein 5 [Coregonus clupeaformis]|uniref:methyl-CpG-binding domain protein 5 n=1 Tax=Coregonus clupeaformis TaxID=59861 RepID=UPI001BDF81C8|nr:methyl-CpG-binding domain protein 5 [Coregonus clupeaformis]XP_041701832.1 methyl-CpG-binding domain protein 5 [Coregonus clupeaformis]
MMGGSESGSGETDGVQTVAIQIPIGWQRRVEDGLVVYVSPSGTVLSSLEEVKSYLLNDGTCKCGLECPLVIHKVFNFSLGVKVQQHSQPVGKAEQDMTKLCNHRRKVVAMAALCRSMQASQLPYVSRHTEVTSGVMENRDPKRMRVDREEEERGTYPSKHHLVQSRPNNNLHHNPCGSPQNSTQLVFSYNGSSPLSHANANSHRSPEILRRLPPPLHFPPTTSQLSSHGAPQRSPCTPAPQNLSHGQRTPQTPEAPRSPHLGPLSPPPPSSPGTLGRGGQSHPHGNIVGSLLSPSCSPSPSVSMNCPSPRQRSRHPSASSSLSEQGVGGVVLGGYPPRRISSSSPHSPLPGGSPNLHFPKYKLEDILEQFRNSGNSSTNNHILYPNSMSNQSNPQILSLALEKGEKPTKAPASATGSGMGISAGPSGLPLGQFLNHQKQPHPASFPASSLLSAAAKAQLASQMSYNHSSNSASVLSSALSLEVSKESQQSKVTNSTLHNSHPSIARPLPAASLLLPHPCAPLSQPLASSPLHLSPTDRMSHRKRQRRSPTVLSMLKDSQMSGLRTPGDVLNLSALHSQPSSTSASPHSAMSENHLQALRVSVRHSSPLTGPQKQPDGAMDFTTIMAGQPDPPTQPLSALLHLLSVQNAQAAGAQPSSGHGTGGMRQSPRQSPSPSHLNIRPFPMQSPSHPSTMQGPSQPLSPSQSLSRRGSASAQSPSQPHTKASPKQRRSPSTALSNAQSAHHRSSPSPTPHTPDRLRQAQNQPMDATTTTIQSPMCQALPEVSASVEMGSMSTLGPGLSLGHPPNSTPTSNHSTTVTSCSTTSPRPLDLSNHVLALLAASSTMPLEEGGLDTTTGNNTAGVQEPQSVHHGSTVTKPPGGCSPGPSPCSTPSLGDSSGSLPLAEAFPFMNQEQLLQLLSATAGLPSLLDPTILDSLPLGLWLGGQQGHLPTSNTPQQHHQLPDQQQQSEHQQLLLQHEQHQEQQQKQQQTAHLNHNFPFSLLPSIMGGQGELPLNLLGLLNPLLPPSTTLTPGQEGDLGIGEKLGLQALLMASLLLGQQQAAMLPLSGLGQLSLDLPLQQQHIPALLEGLSLDKGSGLLDLSSLPGPGLLEALQGMLPPAEGPLQALQSLLLPTPLPPPGFLSLSPALLTAALGSTDLPPTPQLPPPQQPPPQVSASGPDGGVDTLIPLSVQGKDNPILHQLLPTLLNPGLLGDLSALTSLHSLLGLGAGPLLLPPVQTSALGMPLLQGPDVAINLLNNIQLNMAPPSEGEKPISLQEKDSSAPQEDIPANRLAPEAAPSPCPVRAPVSQRGEGSVGSVLDPYASFMDTIYTSFLQVSANEQEAAKSGADALCALPPSYPGEPPAPSAPLPQASAPLSLSPRQACSLRNPELSRLNMEAAHSPAQGTPKPSDDGSATPLQNKPGVPEGHTNPPLPPIYLEEAKTESYSQAVSDRQGDRPQAGGYLSPRDGGSCPKEETVGLQHTEQGRNQTTQTVGARRGRKRKQTLQNVLEDFRDLDAPALEEPKPTVVLLKPERSVRGRRRRGARSQRQ